MQSDPTSQSSRAAPGSWVAAVTNNLPPTQSDARNSQGSSSRNGTPSERPCDQVQRLQNLLDQREKEAHQLKSKNAQERKELRNEITKLEKSLAETRTKLIRFLPKEGPSDDQVKQAFEGLCHSIESWVDHECGDLNDLKARVEQGQWVESDLQLLERYVTEDDLKLAEQYPEISTYIVMSAIFSIIFDLVLADGRWVLGMSNEEEWLLENIAGHIRTNNGSHSSFAERRWRSETYLGLTEQPGRVDEQKGAAKEIAQNLSSFLNHFQNPGGRPINETKVQDKLVTQALKLAGMGNTSLTEYIFRFPVNSSDNDNFLVGKEASIYNFVDARAGVDLENGKVQAGGKLRLCVFPALLKVLEDGEMMQLANSMVVLEQ